MTPGFSIEASVQETLWSSKHVSRTLREFWGVGTYSQERNLPTENYKLQLKYQFVFINHQDQNYLTFYDESNSIYYIYIRDQEIKVKMTFSHFPQYQCLLLGVGIRNEIFLTVHKRMWTI